MVPCYIDRTNDNVLLAVIMMKLLKWIGVAALVSLPVILIINRLRAEDADVAFEDEFDIFGEE